MRQATCNPALAGKGPNAIRSTKTARVHHAARRRSGGVAARGARAAGADAGCWLHEHQYFGRKCPGLISRVPPRSLRKPASSRAKTWRSNTAGRKADTIDFPS